MMEDTKDPGVFSMMLRRDELSNIRDCFGKLSFQKLAHELKAAIVTDRRLW